MGLPVCLTKTEINCRPISVINIQCYSHFINPFTADHVKALHFAIGLLV